MLFDPHTCVPSYDVLLFTQVHAVACDVRDPEAIVKTADACVDICGGLPSMIVNNAAGNFISPTERLSANAWRTIIDIVLNGTAHVTMEFGKRLIAAKQGTFTSLQKMDCCFNIILLLLCRSFSTRESHWLFY